MQLFYRLLTVEVRKSQDCECEHKLYGVDGLLKGFVFFLFVYVGVLMY